MIDIETIPADYVILKDEATDNYIAYGCRPGLRDYIDKDASKVIQSAINALTGGGKIFVKKGEYVLNSRITLADNIKLIGESAKLVALDDFAIYGKDVSNVEIAGFEIDMSGATNNTGCSSGILIESVDKVCKNIYIHDNEIHDAIRAGIHVTLRILNKGTSDIFGYENVVIERNYIHDLMRGTHGADGNGIWIGRGKSNHVIIRNNVIERVLSVGIGVSSDPNFYEHHNVLVEGNYIKNSYNFGMDIGGVWDSIIRSNYFYNDDDVINAYPSYIQGIYIESAQYVKPSGRIIIDSNVFDGMALYAITAYKDVSDIVIVNNISMRIRNPSAVGAGHIRTSAQRITVIGNKIYGDSDGLLTAGICVGDNSIVMFNELYNTTDPSILLGGRKNVVIMGNRIINPARHGIDMPDSTNNVILYNKIEGVPSGYYDIYERGTGDYNIIRYNVVSRGISTVGANTIVKENIGYVTENSASKSATIPIGGGQALVTVTLADLGLDTSKIKRVLNLRIVNTDPAIPDVYAPQYGINATEDAVGITLAAGTGTTITFEVLAEGY